MDVATKYGLNKGSKMFTPQDDKQFLHLLQPLYAKQVVEGKQLSNNEYMTYLNILKRIQNKYTLSSYINSKSIRLSGEINTSYQKNRQAQWENLEERLSEEYLNLAQKQAHSPQTFSRKDAKRMQQIRSDTYGFGRGMY